MQQSALLAYSYGTWPKLSMISQGDDFRQPVFILGCMADSAMILSVTVKESWRLEAEPHLAADRARKAHNRTAIHTRGVECRPV